MTDKPERRIDAEEARRILENLARNGPPTAQVAAIKVLREMDKDERAAAAEAQAGRTGFDVLDRLYDDADDLTANLTRGPAGRVTDKSAAIHLRAARMGRSAARASGQSVAPAPCISA